jgi:tetratricopeptide (TPR) repeat protein
MAGGPDGAPSQDIHPARDAYIAGHDFHYHAGPGERQVTLSAGQVLVGDLPQTPPGFQPRPGLLAALDGPEVVVVQAVTGMRGVGKTQLAAAYARAKLAAGWRLVAWVNAEDATGLASGLASVAEAAGLLGEEGKDPGLVVRHLLEADGDQCLVVFDNAASADVLRPYLPAGGKARVLITSSRQSMAELGRPVEVEVFTPGEAGAFLTDRTGLADEAGAGELAEELGFLPLGLAQAAAVIRGQRLGYATYLERFRALSVAEYLTRQEGQPYPRGVAEAVLLSLRAVQDGDRTGACAGIMEFLSVLSAAGVRRDLLYAADRAGVFGGGPALGEAVVDEALGRLAEWSLLAFTMGGQAVLAHRLVMRVARERLAAEGQLPAVLEAAVKALADAAAGFEEAWHNPAGVFDLARQVDAVTASAANRPEALAGRGSGDLLRLRQRSLDLMNDLGDGSGLAIPAARSLAADYEKATGVDSPEALGARNSLAVAFHYAGHTAEAIPLYEQVLADRQQLLGADHADTLDSRNNLAMAYLDAGRIAEAIPMLEETLASRERVLGDDHPGTLMSRNNLGMAYHEAGANAEAIPVLEQALDGSERILGTGHPDTFMARNNLAMAYQAIGDTAKAIPLLERTAADSGRALGADHARTLSSRNNLAMAYSGAGRTAEAIPLLEQVVADGEWLLDARNPSTLGSRNNLAMAYYDAGRTTEAVHLLEQILPDCERLLGPDHPNTEGVRCNLAYLKKVSKE